MLPPLAFTDDGALSADSIKALTLLKQLPGGLDSYRYLLKASGRNSQRQISAVKGYLTKTLQLPEKAVSVSRRNIKSNQVELMVQVVRQ